MPQYYKIKNTNKVLGLSVVWRNANSNSPNHATKITPEPTPKPFFKESWTNAAKQLINVRFETNHINPDLYIAYLLLRSRLENFEFGTKDIEKTTKKVFNICFLLEAL